jgi:hypothetical protein
MAFPFSINVVGMENVTAEAGTFESFKLVN